MQPSIFTSSKTIIWSLVLTLVLWGCIFIAVACAYGSTTGICILSSPAAFLLFPFTRLGGGNFLPIAIASCAILSYVFVCLIRAVANRHIASSKLGLIILILAILMFAFSW